MMRHNPPRIGLVTTTAFAIGAMIGGGVFALANVALQRTGPSALISFLIAGVIVLLSALSFAVLASITPPKDTGYAYVGIVLGTPLWGFLTSWCFYLGSIISVAFVLHAFGTYLHEFVASGVPVVAWALIGAVVLALINLGPASGIGRLETVLVTGKLAILALLIAFGLMHAPGIHWQSFAPHGGGEVFATSAYLYVAFLGFNVIASISGSIHKPRRTIPIAILSSMVIVTLVYAGIVITLLAAHMTHYSEASVGIAAQHLIGSAGGWLVVIGALVATLSAANAYVLASSEIMVQMAARKQVPTILGYLRHGHPYASVFFGAVVYIVLIALRQAQVVISLANAIAILAIIIVNVAAAKALSSTWHNGLRLPLKWFFPTLGIIGAVVQLFFMGLWTVVISLGLAGVGLLIYLARHRFHLPHLHGPIADAVNSLEGPLSRSLKR